MANARNPKSRSHKTQYFAVDRRSGVSVTGSLADAIGQLGKDINTKLLRSGAHAGALVFYNEMRARVPVDDGDLHDSIYRYHDKNRSGDGFQRYAIGPNKRKAPHWYNVEFGHWRYNAAGDGFWQQSKSKKNARVSTPGTTDKSVHDLPGALDVPVWVPGIPYVRPTFDAVAALAIKAARERMGERLRELQSGEESED